MPNKRFTPPRTSDAELSMALRRVYDDLNALAALVAGDAPAARPGRPSEGAMRVERRGATHYLAVQTAEGEKLLPLPNTRPD